MPIWLAGESKRRWRRVQKKVGVMSHISLPTPQLASYRAAGGRQHAASKLTDVVPVLLGAVLIDQQILQLSPHAVDPIRHTLDLFEPRKRTEWHNYVVSQLRRSCTAND